MSEAWKDFVKQNAGRSDFGFEQIPLVIQKMEARLTNPNFAHKKAYYKSEIKRLKSILEVENS